MAVNKALLGVVIALVIGLVILGVLYLETASRISTLQATYNALSANYTSLKSQYAQLQSQYNTLEGQYEQLKEEYNTLEENYGSVTGASYMSMIKPVAYAYEGQGVDFFVMYLNITNPMGETVNLTFGINAASPLGTSLVTFPTTVTIPPGVTLELPVVWVAYNSTFMFYDAFLRLIPPYFNWANGSYTPGMFNGMGLTVYLVVNRPASIGAIGTVYNTALSSIGPLNKPVGYAWFTPNETGVSLRIINPLPTSVSITGYEVYSYNWTLLTTCTLSQPLEANATGVSLFDGLPTGTTSSPEIDVGWYTLTEGTWPTWTSTTIPLVTCSSNYTFPASLSQMPFGYVVVNTNIGNITELLMPTTW